MADKDSGAGQLTASFTACSDMVYEYFCEACAEDNKHAEAEGFCVECNDFLCGDCVNAHAKNRASKKHVIMTEDQMPRQKHSPPLSRSTTGSINEKCDQHPDRMVEYYCRDEGSLACTVCLVKHRQCKAVDHISDISEHLLDSQEYQEFTASLTTLKVDSNDVIKSTKENTTEAEKLCTDVATALKELRRKVMKAFDTIEGNMVKKTEAIKSADVKKMKEISDKAAGVLDEVEKISAELQTLQGKNHLGQLFVKIIKLEGRIEALHQRLHQANVDNNVTAYMFEPGTGIQGILDDPTSIGGLAVQAADNKAPAVQKKPAYQKTPVSHNMPAQQMMLESRPAASIATTAVAPPTVMPATSASSSTTRDVKAEKIKDINVKTTRDRTECYITGSVLLPGDKMVLADYNNNKLKMLDLLTSKITKELSAPKPRNVASITDNQVVATLYEDKQIMFVKVASSLKVERKIKVGGKCKAILHNNGKLIVSFCEPVMIEIMTMDGTVEKMIDSPGMFQWPCHLALSPGHDAIFVSDTHGQCVKRLSLAGVQEAQFKDENLHGPQGVVVDQQGRVIVCGGGIQGNLHLLTANLAKIKVLVDGLNYPQSISLCRSTGRLYAGRWNNALSVYQLS